MGREAFYFGTDTEARDERAWIEERDARRAERDERKRAEHARQRARARERAGRGLEG